MTSSSRGRAQGPADRGSAAWGAVARGAVTRESTTIRHPTDAVYLRDLFNNSARYYEWVNMVTSLGQVVLWRREVIAAASPRPSDRVLDAFCGPGGLAAAALPRLDGRGELVLADLSPVMLHQARRRLAHIAAGGARGADGYQAGAPVQSARGTGASGATPPPAGPRPRVEFLAGDLLRDDLGLQGFDVVLLGWGLRYVENVDKALARVRSFVRLGGRLVVLEFTRPPRLSWATPAHLYFRRLLPRIGSWLARDPELHEYLSVSAAEFLSVGELTAAVGRAGFTVRSCKSHLDGLVTIVAADAR
jgi:demethylmenaquinone methyltransferase/2-methoxy-6-polyprenyl-1,4-benzoquinol methylase